MLQRQLVVEERRYRRVVLLIAAPLHVAYKAIPSLGRCTLALFEKIRQLLR